MSKKRNIAILFHGLPRSIKHTHKNINEFLIDPLKKNYNVDIYAAVYKLNGTYSNPRNNEKNITIDSSDIFLLNPDFVRFYDQDIIDTELNLKKVPYI